MKKLAVQLIKELTSLSDTIPAGFKGFFAKSSGLFFKNSDGKVKEIATTEYIQSRGENLLTNGTGFLGDNTNFSSWIFDGSQAYGSGGSFKFVGAGSVAINELIPVNPSLKYKFNFYAKTLLGLGKYYAYVGCFDVDKLSINAYHHMYVAGSTTTLSQPLNNGDTVVYLTSAANWYNTGTAGVNIHLRSFIWWDYTNSFGYTYPENTYSRNINQGMWNPGSVDFVNNTITLITPWAGGTKAAGTKVSNGSAGANYKYLGLINTQVPNNWKNYNGIMDGIDYSGTNAYNLFAPGTAFVNVGFLMDYTPSQGDTLWLANLTFAMDLDTNQTIGYNSSVNPTQSGTVVKSLSWVLQYAIQSINWLKANFANYSLTTHNHTLSSLSEKSYNSLTDKPTIPAAQVQTDWNATTGLGVLLNKPASLPANGGDADTVNGLNASAFAKADTAFTSYANIPGNNADCAVFVIDTSSRWISNAIHEILANDITLPSGTSSMVLILQPGIYEIVDAMDFNALNIKAIIGLCKDSTIINVANPDLIINLELIENLTINIQGNSGNIIFGGSALQKNEAHNLKIKYGGSLGYDIEIMCFASYSCINNCIIEGITGVAYKSNNISNITHICENINNYTSVAALQRAVNVSNFTGRYSLPIEVGKDCINLENFSIEFYTADSLLIGCFNDCSMLSNIKILSCDIGFNSCEDISNSIVETDTSNTATVAYSNCGLLSNCKAVAYVGFGGCNKIVSSEALSCNIGFYSSSKISVSRAVGCTLYGFDSCSGLIQNSSDNYNSCFADSNASYAVSDSPAGGFNS